MKAILFHNPKSGTGDHSADELKAILRLAGHDVTYVSTKGERFRKALKLKKPVDLVVVAGGDGTVGKVLKGLKNRTVPIGILPLGTANNIATSLGISGAAAEIVASWSPRRTRALSVGRAEGPWGSTPFIEAVGFGVMAEATDSDIGADAEGAERLVLGRDAFRKALKKTKAHDLKLAIDGKPLEGKLLALEILNIGYAGPGIPLRLAADPSDDRLDVALIDENHRDKMIEWLGPTHEDEAPPLTARKAREIVVHWKGKPRMRLDDAYIEPPGKKARVTLTLEKDQLTILLPKGARRPKAVPKSRAGKKTASRSPATRAKRKASQT